MLGYSEAIVLHLAGGSVNSDYTIFLTGALFFSLWVAAVGLIEIRRRRSQQKNGQSEQFLVRVTESVRKQPPR